MTAGPAGPLPAAPLGRGGVAVGGFFCGRFRGRWILRENRSGNRQRCCPQY